MTEIDTLIGGAESVTSWFGHWPDFHDAEVLEVCLRREGTSTFRIHAWKWKAAVVPSAEGTFARSLDAVVSFAFDRILDLELADFNDQNVVARLWCESTEHGVRLTLSPCFGIAGYIEAERITVSLEPGEP